MQSTHGFLFLSVCKYLYINTQVGEFARGFSEYINDPVRFRMSLIATKIREGANVMYILSYTLLSYLGAA